MSEKSPETLMRLAVIASTTTASVLIALKLAAWLVSGSVSMLGSLTDSVLDLLASVVTLYAVRIALVPADHDHRFGHGKAEALAGLFQGGLMGASSVFLIIEAWARINTSTPPDGGVWVLVVSGLSIVATGALVIFQGYVIKRSGSLAIAGDHLHYKGDFLLNLAVIASILLSEFAFAEADGVFGIGIALYLAYSAWHVAAPAIDQLMDKEFTPEEREEVLSLVLSTPGVLGAHDLRTRRSGRDSFIQLHIDVNPTLTVKEGYAITTEVEAMMSEHFSDAEVLIHLDPASEQTDLRTQRELGPAEA